MEVSKLSDYQLYEIIQNDKMLSDIKKVANDEFNKRKISIDRIQEIIKTHDSQFRPDNNEKLKVKYKLLLIVFPFLVPIHGIIASKLIPHWHKRKIKKYWFYICIGYLFWTIVVLLFSRYVLFAPTD